MKGIIFNLFEDFISNEFSEDQFDDIIDKTQFITSEPFVGPGTYPDVDFISLIDTTSKVLKINSKEVLRFFGKSMFSQVAVRYPLFFKNIDHPKDFLKTVEDVIHVEVKKLYPDAETPKFIYHDLSHGSLIIEYHSKRKLCYMMEGLIDGTADYFQADIKYHQSECMHLGSKICKFNIQFES